MRKTGGLPKWVIVVIVVLCLAVFAAANNNDESSKNNSEQTAASENTENPNTDTKTEKPDDSEKQDDDSEKQDDVPEEDEKKGEITLKEIKAQAKKLKYKKIMRNPEKYEGKYFYAKVKIFSVENGSIFSGYDKAYKAYTNDDYNMWLGDMIYLLDNRDTESKDYVKILEDDIVKVYGRFDELVETKNALNGTKGEEMSLQLLYVELISE